MRRFVLMFLIGGLAVAAATVGAVRPVRAQVVGQFDIPGAGANAASVAPSNVVSGLTFSALTRGGGLSANGSGGTFTSFGFGTASADAALAAGDFIEFTINTNAGTSFFLSSLTYTDSATTPGPANIVVRSSADGFLGDLAAYVTTSGGTARTVTLGGPGFTNVTSPLTFRIAGFNANNPNNGSSHVLQSNPLVVNGGVSGVSVAAPEPGSLSLAALGVLPILGIARARRRNR